MRREYKTVREVVGPLMLVEEVEGVKYNELVKIVQPGGEPRLGRVLEVDGDKALVQLFAPSRGLKISEAKAQFTGKAIELMFRTIWFGAVWAVRGKP